MKNQELKDQKEKEVMEALKGTSDQDILNAINEGTVKKAAKKVSNKKASTKKEVKKAPKTDIYKASVYNDLSTADKKKFRTKTRKKRNKLMDSILSLHQEGKTKERNEQIKAFNIFYKENYANNDLTPLSISASNSDDDTKKKVQDLFNLIKKVRVK